VRRLAVVHASRCLDALATLGARWMNVHLMGGPRLYGPAAHLEWNRECFAALAEYGDACGVGVMVEHPPTTHFSISDIAHVLAVDERLGFHLDVGHANVGGDRLEGMLNRLGSRLAHVHLSDNGGRSDDHLPLGAGTVNWPRAIRLLREAGYDDTITLEVFSPDRDYLLQSAEKVRGWWAEAG
jgi:sugar phosphate isomerase/epimerase